VKTRLYYFNYGSHLKTKSSLFCELRASVEVPETPDTQEKIPNTQILKILTVSWQYTEPLESALEPDCATAH